MTTAERFIARQRESQLEVLQRLMLSPVLEAQAAVQSFDPVSHTAHPRPQVLELRAPRRTARLFLDQAIRAGKDLRPLQTSNFQQLEYSSAYLGRLLRLLAVAQDTPRRERARLADEWRLVTAQRPDVGLVLSPMLYARPTTAVDRGVRQLANELGRSLHEASVEVSGRARDKTLEAWTASLVREGSSRLRELGAPEI
jgi:hypothetical protein